MNLKQRQLEGLRRTHTSYYVVDTKHRPGLGDWLSFLASALTTTFSLVYVVAYFTVSRHPVHLALAAWLAYCGFKDLPGNYRRIRRDP